MRKNRQQETRFNLPVACSVKAIGRRRCLLAVIWSLLIKHWAMISVSPVTTISVSDIVAGHLGLWCEVGQCKKKKKA